MVCPLRFGNTAIGYGDTEKQDRIANTPLRASLGPFGMNAAVYLRNPDGSWNLFNFRLPEETMVESVATAQHQQFITLLRRNDVRLLMESPYDKVDFGTPDDFIYKKMNLPVSALPEPFNRFPSEALEKIEMVMQYNADKTAKAYFQQPFDRESSATELFQKIVDAVEPSATIF